MSREAEVARIAAALCAANIGHYRGWDAAESHATVTPQHDADASMLYDAGLRAEPAEVAGLREALSHGAIPALAFVATLLGARGMDGTAGSVRADIAKLRAALASTEPDVPDPTWAHTAQNDPAGLYDDSWEPRVEPPAPESLDVDWRAAVIAVVDACDTELEGGATDDFERGADAAYNWVLSVIDGNVQVAARLSEGREP